MSEAIERPMAAESKGEAPGRGRLRGRRILVVGGGQDERDDPNPPIGNGRAMSILFAREGADVAIADRNVKAIEKTIDHIAADNLAREGSAISVIADVGQPDSIRQMVVKAREGLRGLDGLVYNVGIGGGVGLEGSMPVLADGSSIVLISSIASMKPGSRMPSYDASKAALAGLMRHAGLEGERRGIRVNIIAPGLMDTSIGREATRGRPNRAKTPVPLGRQGTGWETAYAALFLISDEAAYITGQTIAVDGGMTGLR
jgi:NAD(P)-dependent dehydrogenase (short-subunit alcohol dehydrogenase family)